MNILDILPLAQAGDIVVFVPAFIFGGVIIGITIYTALRLWL